MQNKLIPIESCAGDDTYQPSLVPDGYRHQCLQVDQKFGYRPDLDGLVRECGGMPVIETDEQLFAVQNASRQLLVQCGRA